MEAAIEADALDVSEEPDTVEVLTTAEGFDAVKAALESRGFRAATAEITMLPQTTVKLEGKNASTMIRLIEGLDDHEDVKQVHSNFDISDDELMSATGGG